MWEMRTVLARLSRQSGVARADLFTLIVCPAVIGNRRLIVPFASADAFGENLAMLLPHLRSQFISRNEIAPVKQIARIDVGERLVKKEVERQRNEVISQLVKEVMDAGVGRRKKAASHNDICVKLQNGYKIFWISAGSYSRSASWKTI